MAENQRESVSSRKILARLVGFYKPHRRLLAVVCVLFVMQNILMLMLPVRLGIVVDKLSLLAGQSHHAFDVVFSNAGIYLGIALLAGLAGLVFGVNRTRLQQAVLVDIRTRVFDKIQRLSFSYHDQSHTGGLITKATRDMDKLRQFFDMVLFELIQVIVMTGGSAAFVVYKSPILGGVGFVLLPVTLFMIVTISRKLRTMFKSVNDEYDNVTQVLQEGVTGIRVVKAFGQEPVEIGKFNSYVSKFYDKVVSSVDYYAKFMPLANAIFSLSIPLVLGVGGYLVIRDSIGLGDLTACLLYLELISRRMRMVGRLVNQTQQAVASGERIFQILDAHETIRSGARQEWPRPPQGEVCFENVGFRYSGDKNTLHKLNFAIQPGETVAFVGPTGSGKTTAALLIPRFYDVSLGRITIDGIDVREMDLAKLRSKVSVAFQEPFLFSATIAENIAFGQPHATMGQIQNAAKAAQIADFIDTLDKGYDTIVGERGVNLSGGQKQRLTIARAILMDPAVLILDDCTSAVDAVTEKELKATIEHVARQRTTIQISQRISSVRNADRIIVFCEGRLVQEGKHDDLISVDGTYRSIFYSQTFTRIHPSAVPAGRPSMVR